MTWPYVRYFIFCVAVLTIPAFTAGEASVMAYRAAFELAGITEVRWVPGAWTELGIALAIGGVLDLSTSAYLTCVAYINRSFREGPE